MPVTITIQQLKPLIHFLILLLIWQPQEALIQSSLKVLKGLRQTVVL